MTIEAKGGETVRGVWLHTSSDLVLLTPGDEHVIARLGPGEWGVFRRIGTAKSKPKAVDALKELGLAEGGITRRRGAARTLAPTGFVTRPHRERSGR